jgi:hypothetical protein
MQWRCNHGNEWVLWEWQRTAGVVIDGTALRGGKEQICCT